MYLIFNSYLVLSAYFVLSLSSSGLNIGQYSFSNHLLQSILMSVALIYIDLNTWLVLWSISAGAIQRALDLGADVVVTGRCTDSALTLGPLLHTVNNAHHFLMCWRNEFSFIILLLDHESHQITRNIICNTLSNLVSML